MHSIHDALQTHPICVCARSMPPLAWAEQPDEGCGSPAESSSSPSACLGQKRPELCHGQPNFGPGHPLPVGARSLHPITFALADLIAITQCSTPCDHPCNSSSRMSIWSLVCESIFLPCVVGTVRCLGDCVCSVRTHGVKLSHYARVTRGRSHATTYLDLAAPGILGHPGGWSNPSSRPFSCLSALIGKPEWKTRIASCRLRCSLIHNSCGEK